jgi:hypothetical protein
MVAEGDPQDSRRHTRRAWRPVGVGSATFSLAAVTERAAVRSSSLRPKTHVRARLPGTAPPAQLRHVRGVASVGRAKPGPAGSRGHAIRLSLETAAQLGLAARSPSLPAPQTPRLRLFSAPPPGSFGETGAAKWATLNLVSTGSCGGPAMAPLLSACTYRLFRMVAACFRCWSR